MKNNLRNWRFLSRLQEKSWLENFIFVKYVILHPGKGQDLFSNRQKILHAYIADQIFYKPLSFVMGEVSKP